MTASDGEDATAESEKESARTKVVDALRNLYWQNKIRAVRINHPESAHGAEDVSRLIDEAGDRLEVVVVPKIDTPEQIHHLDSLIEQAIPRGKSLTTSSTRYSSRRHQAGRTSSTSLRQARE